jgi:GR25 family glycosyltransferase involved in LPS biosynthesis
LIVARVRHFPDVRPADRVDSRSIGVSGCSLSVLAVLDQAVAEGADSLLLEDDSPSHTNISALSRRDRTPVVRELLASGHHMRNLRHR